MAIRDDFTAGEVLAAADLNDTFASKPPFAYGTATPTTTVEGFIWYDENDTPPTAKFWDGSTFENITAPSGFVHINTTSFTSAGSVSINNCFSSDYDTYKIIGYYTAKSNLGQDYFRLRVSGSDASSAYYFNNIYTSYTSATTSNNAGSNTNQIQVSYLASAATGSAFTFDVLNPFLADQTYLFFNSNQGDGISLSGAEHRTATSYDGFTFYPSTGTFTSGIIRVFGYKNS